MNKQILKIKDVTFGEGMPKVCVSLIGKTNDELMKEVNLLKAHQQVDVVEWRMDHHLEVANLTHMEATLKELRQALGDKLLLATFRSQKEGGEKEVSTQYYKALNQAIIASGLIDLVDVELFTGDEVVKAIVDFAHSKGVKVIMSNHDFEKTPPKEAIISRLCKMQEMKADLPKIAVMPESTEDVLTLLVATNEMKKYAETPIITMSMGKLGIISRLAGETCGSCMTFGAMGVASAPGQIPVDTLCEVLSIMHQS